MFQSTKKTLPKNITALDPETPFNELVPLEKIETKFDMPAIDPNENLKDIQMYSDSKTLQHQERLQKTIMMEKEKEKEAKKLENKLKEPLWKTIVLSQLGVATASALIAAALLYMVNPPITQVARTDNETSEKQDWRKVLFVVAIVFFIVFAMPEVLRLFKIFDK